MNNNLPKVSVVTLTYRNFAKLYDTIASVLAQDYENIEYIISDDGSENFPCERLVDYLSKIRNDNVVVKIIQNTMNVGTVKNANKAYKEATGVYIFNLSCGDVFFTNSVVSRIVKRFIDSNANVIVTTRLFYENNYQPLYFLPHYEERKILKKFDTPIKQYKSFILSRFYDMASGSAMYFTSDVIRKYNYFDERYRLWEDGPFLAKYLWDDKLEMAYDIVSIWYEKGGMSTNKSHPAKIFLSKDGALFALEEKLEHINCFTDEEKKIIEFDNLGILARNRWHLWYLRLKYFPQFCSFILYRLQRAKNKQNDFEYIKSLLDKCKGGILPRNN